MTTIRNSIQLNSVQSSLNTLKTNEFQKATDGVKIANGAAVLTGVAAAAELWVIVSPLIGINQNNSANPYSSGKINYISPERDLFEKGLLKYLDTVQPAKALKKDIAALEKWLKTTDYSKNSASVIESAHFYVKHARAAQAKAGYVFMSDKGGNNSSNSGNNNTVSRNNGGGRKTPPPGNKGKLARSVKEETEYKQELTEYNRAQQQRLEFMRSHLEYLKQHPR
jgi:hypothetical protein